jgi:hypothetical protein
MTELCDYESRSKSLLHEVPLIGNEIPLTGNKVLLTGNEIGLTGNKGSQMMGILFGIAHLV